MIKTAFFAALLVPVLVGGPAYGNEAEAAKPPLSAKAAELVRRYEVYKSSPDVATAQLDYLNGFPNNASAFKKLFDMDDFSELYYGSEKYVFLLKDIAQ